MLTCEGLTRDYGKFRALDGLNMTIRDGELHGFVGPNGAGKTTTMRILATLLPQTSGIATVDGLVLSRHDAKVRKLIGYMPDFFGVYDSLKVWEYLDFYARCYGMRAASRVRQIDKMLALVKLTDHKQSYVDALSRGMKQRLCLARALIHDPKVLILDEPASGMDPRARAEMRDILRALKDMGMTVLISSHILPELSEMCDSLTIIDRGKLVFSGSVEELDRKMNGDAPVDIRVACAGEDEIEGAITFIKAQSGVTDVAKRDDGLLRVALPGGDEHAQKLLKQLIDGGYAVSDFHREPMNLEKVFMEVTK